eukprot:609433-Amorphochlora_amoeboformis.AAC.1
MAPSYARRAGGNVRGKGQFERVFSVLISFCSCLFSSGIVGTCDVITSGTSSVVPISLLTGGKGPEKISMLAWSAKK